MHTPFLDQVIIGDCLEILNQISDDSVDVCFADPPFNLKKKYTSYQDKKALEEYLAWCEKWLAELVRVTKPTGSIFVHNIPKWLTYFASYLNQIAFFRHWISWDSMSVPLGKTLLPAHYGILYYTKRAKGFKFYEVRIPHKTCRLCGGYIKDYGGKKAQMHPFGTLASDVWTDIHRIRHNKRRDEHPCQLPIHLLERIVLMSSQPGDVILDPFVGTGTTAIAAKRLGRHFIGMDLDAEYAQIAREKVARARSSRYGGKYVSIFLNQIVSIRDIDCADIPLTPCVEVTPTAVQLSFYEDAGAYKSDDEENAADEETYACVTST
ncbi:site-specific DNA-methyltransferase [Candidatus Poribacteria bacterium]|nr:site-specific DNA-methyltransferase [Candidatus Poribacteria bacterium]